LGVLGSFGVKEFWSWKYYVDMSCIILWSAFENPVNPANPENPGSDRKGQVASTF